MQRSDLALVAETVLMAMEMGLPVIRSIQEVHEVDERVALNLLRSVRRAGLLGTRDHRPTKAVVFRGTARERRFLVCEICMDRWPCEVARREVR